MARRVPRTDNEESAFGREIFRWTSDRREEFHPIPPPMAFSASCPKPLRREFADGDAPGDRDLLDLTRFVENLDERMTRVEREAYEQFGPSEQVKARREVGGGATSASTLLAADASTGVEGQLF